MEPVTSSSPSPATRTHADRCPGLLRPHRAADGALVRLRIPGGAISTAALRQVSAAAIQFGDGQVQITSRGNLQLRGIPVDRDGEVPSALVDGLLAAGLLPSPSHELVRNIVCSPLTGRAGGHADLRPLVAELDERLCATPDLAALPGRFLFALDDGRGDVFALAHDLGLLAVDAAYARLSAAGMVGPVIPLGRAVSALLVLAQQFLERRGTAWHVRELRGDSLLPGSTSPALPPVEPLDHGTLIQADGRGLVSLGVPLATLTAPQIVAATAAADSTGSGHLVVTPWRGLLIPDIQNDLALENDVADLGSAGFMLDPLSPWRGITACAGAPGCAKAAAATRPVAARLARVSSAAGLDVHVVACGRRCGAPTGDHVEVLAGPSGFTVSGPPGRVDINCDTADLADVVALARTGS